MDSVTRQTRPAAPDREPRLVDPARRAPDAGSTTRPSCRATARRTSPARCPTRSRPSRRSLQALAIVAVWLLFARSGREPRAALLVASAAAVCAFIAFGKVLSPQFLDLAPAARAVPRSAAGPYLQLGLFVAALVVTQLWFPYRYWDVVDLRPDVVARAPARRAARGAVPARCSPLMQRERAAPRTS